MPRIVSAPHPQAVGSYGPELLAWALERSGMHPKRTTAHRWWQELVICLALQHDTHGELLMRNVLLGTARQSGKSWTVRELCMWRLEQAERFGELQTVVHAAAKLSQAEGVWRPAALWAKRNGRGEYVVRQSNGSAQIGRADGSAWIPQAANDQLGVSMSVGLAFVDEAWDVPRYVVENGLMPTMAEAVSPQLWVVSTAGRPRVGDASDLYPVSRGLALDEVTAPRSRLIVEWSADPDDDPGDPATWRKASPHWDSRRADLLAGEWDKARKSQEALESFWMQWLNVWPDRAAVASTWLPADVWAAARVPGLDPAGWCVVAVEDRAGGGGFAAVAWQRGDGIVGTVAAEFESLAAAWAWGDRWAPGLWLCGMSLRTSAAATDRAAERRGTAETAGALPGLRELVMAGGLVWDSEPLAANMLRITVVDHPDRSGVHVAPTPGVDSGPVRCAAWAVDAVQRQLGAALSA